MSDVQHPFDRDRIGAVADESGVDESDLDAALDAVQEGISRERGDGEYEYSSQHNYGWRDDAYYLYGDGIWNTLGEELSASEDVLSAAREVHRREMVESAAKRGERDSVESMFDEGTEPLVVVDTASDPPLYGQDV
jgi:hypothetical protein